MQWLVSAGMVYKVNKIENPFVPMSAYENPSYFKLYTAEVDFVVQIEEEIIPVEVKAATNLKSRSLLIYREKYKPEIAIRTSLSNLRMDDGLLNLPLYMLWTMEKIVKRIK